MTNDFNSAASRALTYKEYVQREERFERIPFNQEIGFYSYVMEGDIKTMEELTKESLLSKREGWGVLSKNSLQNLKYHFVITAALIARYCINAGMPVQTAYNLSDYYIQKADTSSREQEVADLHTEMCMDYTRHMHSMVKKKICSMHVVKSVDFIYNHLHTRLTNENLARYVGVTPAHLSRLFKEELGCTINDYIIDKKIETAQNMLVYSDYTIIDISNILAFPSQSYFTSVFKKKTGKTPRAYRQEYAQASLGLAEQGGFDNE